MNKAPPPPAVFGLLLSSHSKNSDTLCLINASLHFDACVERCANERELQNINF